jgi:hypothetical protein
MARADSETEASRDLVPSGEFLIHTTEDGRTQVRCLLLEETLWLTQAQMADLFQVSAPTINEHLSNLFEEGECEPERTIRKFRIVRMEGGREVRRLLDHYHLEAILSVGFRVRSTRGTQFRQWATERLGEYLVKGFTMDDERLKNPPVDGSGVQDHFDDLLERIREIRASERRMYLRIREIFALAADYQPSAKETTLFFQVIQNKLHYAATGLTAPELILRRADHAQPNMGLTTTKGRHVRKADVTVAKNYLHEDEISELNRIVVMWLDFAEDQARRRKQVFLKDWEIRLNDFLAFNERRVLDNPGKVSKADADARANEEYEQFAAQQRARLEEEGEKESVEVLAGIAKRLHRGQKKPN